MIVEIQKSARSRLRIALLQYQGRGRVDFRALKWGPVEFKPRDQGVVIPLERLDEAIAGLVAVRNEAAARGLLKPVAALPVAPKPVERAEGRRGEPLR